MGRGKTKHREREKGHQRIFDSELNEKWLSKNELARALSDIYYKRKKYIVVVVTKIYSCPLFILRINHKVV